MISASVGQSDAVRNWNADPEEALNEGIMGQSLGLPRRLALAPTLNHSCNTIIPDIHLRAVISGKEQLGSDLEKRSHLTAVSIVGWVRCLAEVCLFV